jgi:hypothetical protein
MKHTYTISESLVDLRSDFCVRLPSPPVMDYCVQSLAGCSTKFKFIIVSIYCMKITIRFFFARLANSKCNIVTSPLIL